jgi:hypothetical protein
MDRECWRTGCLREYLCLTGEVLKLWGAPLGERLGASGGGGGVDCIRDIFFNEIWVQDKIYFDRNFAWLKYFIYHNSNSTGSEI